MPNEGEVTQWHNDGHLLFVFIGADPIMACPFDGAKDAPCSTGAMQSPGLGCRLSSLDGVGMGEIDSYFVGHRFEIQSPIELVWRERFESGGDSENAYWYLELRTIEALVADLGVATKTVFRSRNQQALRMLLSNRSKRELEAILDAVEQIYENSSSAGLHDWWFGDIQIGDNARTCRFYTEFAAATTKTSEPDQPG